MDSKALAPRPERSVWEPPAAEEITVSAEATSRSSPSRKLSSPKCSRPVAVFACAINSVARLLRPPAALVT